MTGCCAPEYADVFLQRRQIHRPERPLQDGLTGQQFARAPQQRGQALGLLAQPLANPPPIALASAALTSVSSNVQG